MAYRRYSRKTNYRKKRTYRRRKTPAPPKDDVWAVAKGAWNIGKKVLRLINVEHKQKVHTTFGQSISASGVCVPLFHNDGTFTHAISQGDTHESRDGNSIKPLTFSFKASMYVPTATTATSGGDQLRIIIFKHQQNNAQTVAVTDYLNSASVRSFKKYDNRFQYQTLYDRTFELNVNDVNSRQLDFTKKLFGHMTYATGSDNIETGAYYMIAISTTNVAGNMPALYASWRMTYTDN